MSTAPAPIEKLYELRDRLADLSEPLDDRLRPLRTRLNKAFYSGLAEAVAHLRGEDPAQVFEFEVHGYDYDPSDPEDTGSPTVEIWRETRREQIANTLRDILGGAVSTRLRNTHCSWRVGPLWIDLSWPCGGCEHCAEHARGPLFHVGRNGLMLGYEPWRLWLAWSGKWWGSWSG